MPPALRDFTVAETAHSPCSRGKGGIHREAVFVEDEGKATAGRSA